jgi:hypothetical protein
VRMVTMMSQRVAVSPPITLYKDRPFQGVEWCGQNLEVGVHGQWLGTGRGVYMTFPRSWRFKKSGPTMETWGPTPQHPHTGAQNKAGAAMTTFTMVLVTHGVELSTGTWWLRNPLMSQRGRMPNPNFGAGGARAKWSLALACHPCFQLVLCSCSGTLAKISPFSSFPESSLGSCSERTQNLWGWDTWSFSEQKATFDYGHY